MDKATRALILAEDAMAQLSEVHRALKSNTRMYFAAGKTANINGMTCTSFGKLTVRGDTAINVAFSGGTISLLFGNDTIASGVSPLYAVLTEGSGVLRLFGTRTSPRALIIGLADFTPQE